MLTHAGYYDLSSHSQTSGSKEPYCNDIYIYIFEDLMESMIWVSSGRKNLQVFEQSPIWPFPDLFRTSVEANPVVKGLSDINGANLFSN